MPDAPVPDAPVPDVSVGHGGVVVQSQSDFVKDTSSFFDEPSNE